MARSHVPASVPVRPADLPGLFPDRRATRVYQGPIVSTSFVSALDLPPSVQPVVTPRVRVLEDDGANRYEIRLQLTGADLRQRTTAPSMSGTQVLVSPPDHPALTRPFRPSHLPFVLKPEPIPSRFRRVRRRRPPLHGIIGTDDRIAYNSTAYPWSAIGRCDASSPFSGVLVGPRHVLTCSHGIAWSNVAGTVAEGFTFVPGKFGTSEPFGNSYGIHVYYKRQIGDSPSQPDDNQLDYVVVVLNDRLGDVTGWFGVRGFDSAWNRTNSWWHAGYPWKFGGTEPTYQELVTQTSVAGHPVNQRALDHDADTGSGHSGGPMFGYLTEDAGLGPRAVAVHRAGGSPLNEASSGTNMVDLVVQARINYP